MASKVAAWYTLSIGFWDSSKSFTFIAGAKVYQFPLKQLFFTWFSATFYLASANGMLIITTNTITGSL